MRGLILVLVMGLLSPVAIAGPVTTSSLIGEMSDMFRLTRFPDPSFKTVQFSSYDRRSSVPGGKDWFANADGFGGEPIPNFEAVLKAPQDKVPGEYLVCDVAGPGAIVRVWTAQMAGSLRVVLDESVQPIYDGPAEEFLLHPYNSFLAGTDLTPEVLAGTFYQRNAAYAPMPFAKHCRITWKGNDKETHFYQIQIRRYDAGATVKTFTAEDIQEAAPLVLRTVAVLRDAGKQWPCRSMKDPVPIKATVAAHAVVEALKLEGGGAVEGLVLKVGAPARDLALRQTILHIQCDGAPWAQVEAPVGDFFGAGPGLNPYSSLPFTVSPDGTMTCRYVMPFKASLRVLLDNRGDQEVVVTGSVLAGDYTWDDTSMYFRARWRVDHGLVANGEDKEERGPQDLPFLLARGQGLYVGTSISLLNPNPIPTSDGNWWGEGDEKIFVDNDVRPSTFGTGSEDYFNYAWSATDVFAFPYCGQPRNDGPANRGFVSNFRWHIVDPLPFTHALAFYMELFSHERTEGISYARLSYCYGRDGLTDDHVAIKDEDVRMPALPATWEPAARLGSKGAIFRACEDLVADKAAISMEEGPMWQGGRVLVWKPETAGAKLTMAFAVEAEGDYGLSLTCMLRPDGGVFRAEIDGQPLRFENKDAVKLMAPYHVLSYLFGAPAKHLKNGKHELSLIAVEPGKPIGIDFLGIHRQGK